MPPKQKQTQEPGQQSEWKVWDEGLFAEVKEEHPVIPIKFDVKFVLDYVKRHGAMFIQGSPSCGKSSLGRAVVTGIQKKLFNHYEEVFICKEKDAVTNKADALEKNNRHASCLFIADEAQALIAQGVLSPSTLVKAGFHVLYLGTSLPVETYRTPAELMCYKHWMYAPDIKRDVVRDFSKRVLVFHGATHDEAATLSTHAFDYVGASMGMLLRLLKAIVENKGTLPTPEQLLEKYKPRVVVNGNPNWREDVAKRALAQELLAVGSIPADRQSHWTKEQHNLLRMGFVCPLRTVESSAAIVHWEDQMSPVGWAHSWQPTYCRYLDPPIEPLPTEADPAAGQVETAIDALLRVLASFNVEKLTPGLVAGCLSTETSEYDFQGAFHVAMDKVMPSATVLAEKHTVNSQGVRGRIDFVVQNNSKNLGIELVRFGHGNVEEHLQRFDSGAKYSHLNLHDHIVLVCSPAPVDKTATENHPHVATISPNEGEGWNSIVLDFQGKRLNIPRDGVPRSVSDWDSPRLRVTRKLVVGKVWVKAVNDVPAFSVSPDTNDIDSLKKAIKAQLPKSIAEELMSSRITILDPDTQKPVEKQSAHH